MVGEIEAIADAMTGTMLGRAVEPEAGEGRNGEVTSCLNCNATITGNHCQHCGQKAKVHRTLGAFGNDILHSVLHFDGKIWRTLPLLAWYPGELTRRYIHGERAKFVSPIALFLFTVFLTFAVFNWMGGTTLNVKADAPVTAAQAAKALADDRAEMVADLKELEAEKKTAAAENTPTGWMDTEIARQRKMLVELDTEQAPEVRRRAIAERKLAIKKRQAETEIAELEAKLAAARKAGSPTKAIEDDLEGLRFVSNVMETATGALNKDEDVKWNFTDVNFAGSESLNAAAKQAVKNPQLLIYKIQSNAYKFSWALIPISVPFLWLLFFWRRKFKLFDHAVFVTYSLCFMMALGLVGGLILYWSEEGSAVFVITICFLTFFPPIHIYRQIHRAYETSRFGAIWRTVLLSNFAVIALSVFITLIFALGVTS